jgi:hypothetical protein
MMHGAIGLLEIDTEFALFELYAGLGNTQRMLDDRFVFRLLMNCESLPSMILKASTAPT